MPTALDSPAEAQRLFHGRGHAYPGLEHVCVDWFPPVVLITLYGDEDAVAIRSVAEEFVQRLPGVESVLVQYRNLRMGPTEIVWGREVSDLVIQENGLSYKLQLGANRNHGLFLDMANGREWVRRHSKNKAVLNLFSYTCGFSIAAIEGGAHSVLNVDMSSAALSVGRENHRLNEHELAAARFEKLDIFRSFGRLIKRGPYDLLICDPPTLQKGSVDIERDYPKIVRRLDRLMNPESDLLLCLNAPDLNSEFLQDLVENEAPSFQFVEQLENPKAFVEAQGRGLKVLHFKSS